MNAAYLPNDHSSPGMVPHDPPVEVEALVGCCHYAEAATC